MIAIVKYNAGNTQSVANAIGRLGYDCIVTDDREQIAMADKVILPGVGEAGSAMASLTASGVDVLLKSLQQPVLGICLGLQLMCRHTEEGNTQGLDIFDCCVRRFPSKGIVPHMGWNTLSSTAKGLFKGIDEHEHMYFVHSYYAALSQCTSAQCDYLLPFSAALEKDNFYAVQFHPEKSGKAGAQLLKNFLAL